MVDLCEIIRTTLIGVLLHVKMLLLQSYIKATFYLLILKFSIRLLNLTISNLVNVYSLFYGLMI
jgi:hypothetical protein